MGKDNSPKRRMHPVPAKRHAIANAPTSACLLAEIVPIGVSLGKLGKTGVEPFQERLTSPWRNR